MRVDTLFVGQVVAALLMAWMLGPWPFVALVFLFAATRWGRFRASVSTFGVKAELEGEKAREEHNR